MEKAKLVEEFGSRAGTALPADLMRTGEQVRELKQAGLAIGAHTVSHTILSSGASGNRAPVDCQGRRLEENTSGPVEMFAFAYPNGRFGEDFTEAHTRLAPELGLKAVVTTRPWVSHPPHQPPGNSDGSRLGTGTPGVLPCA